MHNWIISTQSQNMLWIMKNLNLAAPVVKQKKQELL
jgi:hypothetical protein